ncbi:hypothetical protein RJT34_18192 [Clitoria ternatea]|uniref:Uncharacterized protein n=1 Tax=Clitoria ternatea TaxID=43366 RepID=A0AAN9JBM2_CLITE
MMWLVQSKILLNANVYYGVSWLPSSICHKQSLMTHLPQQVVVAIHEVKPVLNPFVMDIVVWRNRLNDEYPMSSNYLWLAQNQFPPPTQFVVWRLPPRVINALMLMNTLYIVFVIVDWRGEFGSTFTIPNIPTSLLLTRLVSWIVPLFDVVALNVDASFHQASRSARIGGLLRDDMSGWVVPNKLKRFKIRLVYSFTHTHSLTHRFLSLIAARVFHPSSFFSVP